MQTIERKMLNDCPKEAELAAYIDGSLDREARNAVEGHIASCDKCLADIVSAHESVREFKNSQRGDLMKKLNWYFIGMAITFLLSFVFARYFLQFLIATIILGTKWIIDAKNTRILVTIYDAWRKGGEKETSRILGRFSQK